MNRSLDLLIAGYRRFRETYYASNQSLFEALAHRGQSPKAMMVACCDSRVDPAIILGAEPGDLFMVRNVANLIPPYSPDSGYHGTSAALEFAVRNLQVEHIIIMGHARCGGVRALLEDRTGEGVDFINPWMQIAADAREAALAQTMGQLTDETQRICEHENIKVSLINLRSYPWIRERVQAGKLQVHGWYFDIESGAIHWLDPVENEFQVLAV